MKTAVYTAVVIYTVSTLKTMSENPANSSPSFFVAGGTLRPNAPSYVERTADGELFTGVMEGEFCYVLTARQMGKSSLMVRTAHRLRARGVKTAMVDLTGIGSKLSEDQWYIGLLTRIKNQLKLDLDVTVFWKEKGEVSITQKFTDFFENILETHPHDQVVIFIDEIDVTKSLEFTDDFFGAIRFFYNQRAENAEYNRLSVVLLGVASPTDLIKDSKRTAFNIGKRIELQGFSKIDCTKLEKALEELIPGKGKEIFSSIYSWTNGHPYLTQRLCRAISDLKDRQWTGEMVDEFVRSEFSTSNAHKEVNLKAIQSQILQSPIKRELLRMYRRIYDGKRVETDPRSPMQNDLLLMGLVYDNEGELKIYNEIYRLVFNKTWIKANLPFEMQTALTWSLGILALLIASFSIVDLMQPGSLIRRQGQVVAGYVAMVYATPTPKPVISPTATEIPTITLSPTITITLAPTAAPTFTPTVTFTKTPTSTPTVTPYPVSYTISISEVMANPCGMGDEQLLNEYIELYNYGEFPVDVGGWRLYTTLMKDNPDRIVSFRAIDPSSEIPNTTTDSTVISPGSYAVIIEPLYALRKSPNRMPYKFPEGTIILSVKNEDQLNQTPRIGNKVNGLISGDSERDGVILYTGSTTGIDQLVSTYGVSLLGKHPASHKYRKYMPLQTRNCQSVERVDPSLVFPDDGDFFDNWQVIDGGTPGW